MDDKEVRIDSGLGTSIHNDCNKRHPNGNVTYTNRDKSYPDSSHPLGKTDTRPCAIIGPDRVLPSIDSNDVYMKTIPAEPWEYPNNYRHPYDSIKMSEYHQTNNISPRQTFQENMQRIMVPPTYSSNKSSDETSLKNPKLNIPMEGKYCDVPYSLNTLSSEPKSVRSDSVIPTINPSFPRGVQPHGWPGGGIQPLKPYQAHDYYHNSEYSNYPTPRPMPIVQPQRIVHDEIHPMYSDRLYQESNIRFKPYPTSKEKFPQPRYDYSNTFQPPQNPIQKSVHGHHYPVYPQGPYQYTVERRYPEPMMETHPRALYPQHNTFRTHPIHPTYGPIPGNFYNNKQYPYPSDNPKSLHTNKLSYDANNKIYLELENPRYKGYPNSDNFYYNDRAKLMRGDIVIPGHTQMNSMGQQYLYKKDNLCIKNYDISPHRHPSRDNRNLGNPLARMPLQFSPNTVSISPCDSNTSNEALMLGIPQEDCGYVSQSSTTSIRSLDSNNSVADFYKKQGFNYTSTNQTTSRRDNNSKPASAKDNNKGLNLSQFFQMWNEGDEEVSASNNNEVQINSNYVSPKPQANNNQEQLYILGSVTVSQEELSKYDHLQKVSKLPENIKGFNNIEILNQFEQLVESPSMNNSHVKNLPINEYKVIPQTFPTNEIKDGLQRPVSPLDVEAKISQSVIHKEVGCNFEIKPCSPKVLNVDVAAPVHDVLGERFIEKVANPVLLSLGKDAESKIEIVDQSMKITSCKMSSGKFNQNVVNSAIVKPLYPVQDLNANMGVCLASLPQLDSEIDLNLPEVNQQFIDANKISTPRSPHGKVLLLENTHSKNNTLNKIQNEGPVTYLEVEKETTKLSKYRKTKRADTLVNNPITASSSVSSAQRTDSVIIKNPENVKACNESQNESLEMVNNILNKMTQENNNTEPYKNVVTPEDIEKAIDFSVNKSEKIINTESEVSKSTPSLTKESHFYYQSNINSSMKGSKNTKKLEKTPDLLRTITNSFEKLHENIIDHDNNSDFHNPGKEKYNTNEETHEKLVTSKELSQKETMFYDFQSVISASIGQDLNESVKDQKINIEHDHEDIKKEEIILFPDNPAINSCDGLNNLPDLSFELTEVSTEQSPHTDIKYNSNHKIDDSKLETASSGFTTGAVIQDNTVIDQISNMHETSNCIEKTCTDNKKSKIVVDTEKLVDTIEKELEDMDTKCDVTLNDLSQMNNPSTTSEVNANYLLQENLNEIPSSSSVNVIKPSDASCNIKNEEFCSKSANKTQKCTSSTDFTVDEKVLQTHNAKKISAINNEKDEISLESPPDEKNLECQKPLLVESQHNIKSKGDSYSIDGKICNLSGEADIDNSLGSNTCDEIKCKDNRITDLNKTAEITADTTDKDCKSPMAETSCDQIKKVLTIDNSSNQKQQAIEIDNNNQDMACILQNDDVLTCKSDDDFERNYVYEKFNSNHYKRQVHRKALYSPWIQNLILYNTDNQILCKDKNDTQVNILNHKIHLVEDIDESINAVHISNKKIELDYATENVKQDENDCATKSGAVEVLHSANESNDDINKNVDNSESSQIFQNSGKVECTIRKTDSSCFVSTEFDQAHPVRCPSPGIYTYGNNTKLLKRTTKRSLSDSALGSSFQEDEALSAKRCKRNEEGLLQSPNIETNLSNIFRRNSISEIYNDGNVVILIDKDLILTEDRQETKICFAGEEEIAHNYDSDREIIDTIAENLPEYEKELWVDDVACTETVFSDDVAEDVEIGSQSSPKDFVSSNYETVNNESFMLCEEVIKNMENDVDLNELNTCHNSTYSIRSPYDYHGSNLDDIFTCLDSPNDSEMLTDDKMESNRRKAENILNHFEISTALFPKVSPTNGIMQEDKENVKVLNSLTQETETDMVHSNKLHIQKNSDCENYDNYSCTVKTCNYSSSPEVTSTTCEDKTPGIVLKISNHKRSKSSQLEDSKPVIKSNISYKLTEKKKYKPNFNSSGTLITKAAQKYIPPIKITISDLKVKLPLPKNSLDKLKQLKKSKVEPKIEKKPVKTYSFSTPREMKKPKPKFEDVLMSIDKFQYSKPKVKNKKTIDQIPKVVIKKNESGSHYTSSSSSRNEDTQSPDLTGRKWQPWVFIEKNAFIDKMALKHKVKAIYCRRKKSFILADKFRKYKSVYNAKFVISQPKSDDLNKGNLKYTIRLKHY